MRAPRLTISFGLLVLLATLTALAQPQQRRRSSPMWRGGMGGGGGRPMPSRESYPTWENAEGFEDDVFTFVRIQYDSFGPFGWWDRWDNDYPDSDWNFSHRLQQLTSLKVNPDSAVVTLTDPALFDYPFIYFAGAAYISMTSIEHENLRRYLLNGGFMMVDDLWNEEARANMLREMRQVLPDTNPIELPLEHEIFHNVYNLTEFPQVVDMQTYSNGYMYEHNHGGTPGDQKPHFIAYFDPNDRMVALVCHNNDVGDGWEREGESPEYFERFSVKHAYPLGINIITYAMTH